MIGLIIPPGQIKTLIQTTAEWVASNGSNFEQFIIQKSQNDAKFAFLNTNHPYRGYFDTMVGQYRLKLNTQQQQAEAKEAKEENIEQEVVKKEEAPVVETGIGMGANEEQKEFLERVFREIKVPDPDMYYVEVPEKLTLFEIDVIQHTAQYVAKNGKKFLEALGQRQRSNPQFQFMKSTSSLYKYFLSLIDSYTKVLSLKPIQLDTLSILEQGKYQIFQRCSQIFEYQQSQLKNNKVKKAAIEQEQDNIDWTDFELVETIEFEDEYQYQDTSRNTTSIDHLTDLMRKKLAPQTQQYGNPLQSIVHVGNKNKEIMQACLACGKQIPVSQINAHIKSCMLDPREKARRLQAQNKRVLAGNEVDVYSNINMMLGRQSEPGKNKVSAIFDGQNPNITRTTGSIAMMESERRKLNESLYKNQKK